MSEIQARAQEEIDRVIGDSQRLPDYSDRANLPYITAIMKETFRWHPPAPNGGSALLLLYHRMSVYIPAAIPHFLIEDDHYRGYVLKKGTIVIGNSWYV